MPPRHSRDSAPCEDWPKTGLSQNASDLFSLISLNLNPAVFDGSAGAAGFLHLFRELLLLRQANAHEALNHRYSLATAARFLPDDVYAPAAFPFRGSRTGAGGRTFRKASGGKRVKGVVVETRSTVSRIWLGVDHSHRLVPKVGELKGNREIFGPARADHRLKVIAALTRDPDLLILDLRRDLEF